MAVTLDRWATAAHGRRRAAAANSDSNEWGNSDDGSDSDSRNGNSVDSHRQRIFPALLRTVHGL
ncbi:hypothetical protein [Paraburkholderia kururiensis]|uniref:Uncharacterized protein n=1 Tax=Paraburkholderia kururiensis TaxID=984307 RepID=A0ABZ0WV25_9BURK|nr:hypothetical protein [Paraburkholderia kururiensis]WQD81249.1 hypothetical protein U0042_08755 [Paraburkholderia kururiensis]